MDLHLRTVVIGDVPTVVASGEVDLSTTPQLRATLLRVIAGSPATVVAVDIDGVGALDDSGLGALLGAAGRARTAGGDLVIVCSAGRLRERLALTGLDRAVRVVASVSEATVTG